MKRKHTDMLSQHLDNIHFVCDARRHDEYCIIKPNKLFDGKLELRQQLQITYNQKTRRNKRREMQNDTDDEFMQIKTYFDSF